MVASQLQISANTAEKWTELEVQTNNPKRKKHNSQNHSGPLWECLSQCVVRNGRGPPRVWYFIIIFRVQLASKGILGHTQIHIRCCIGHVCDSRLYSHCIPIFDAFPLSPIFKQSLFLPIFALLIVLMWNSRSPIMEFNRDGSSKIGRQSQTWLSLLACKNCGQIS